jgi:hypothetical protein
VALPGQQQNDQQDETVVGERVEQLLGVTALGVQVELQGPDGLEGVRLERAR